MRQAYATGRINQVSFIYIIYNYYIYNSVRNVYNYYIELRISLLESQEEEDSNPNDITSFRMLRFVKKKLIIFFTEHSFKKITKF